MKPWLRLLIAVVVLAAVVGVLYWPKKTPPAAPPAPPLVKLNSGDVRGVTISQPNTPTVVLTKSGDNWALTQPYAYAADSAAVSSMLDSLGNITGAQAVGDAGNLAAFGLDHPSSVQLTMADGKTEQFDFGSDTPTGGNTYLRVNNAGPVEMASSDAKSSAIKSAFLLQDKTVLHFPSDKVTALDVASAGKSQHFDKGKDGWPKDRASDIESLVDALSDGQMTAMPDPTGKAAAADGLAKPTATLTLTWTGGTGKLEIGAKKGAAEYYARNSSGPAIFTLSDYLVTDITGLTTPAKPAATTPAH
ncbi:MAG TPA: DUF4340 domain-containing protein [Terriglobales bacterium]|nr:DUF4340 domain-containing protein [Terriglobales bacterium]